MFNLEQSIADWRRQMLAAGIKSPVPLDELESHLRDEIEHQMQSGLDAPQAFAAAFSAIGRPKPLQTEFVKSRILRGYRISAIINSSIGAFLLLLAVVSVLIEKKFPSLGHSLSWGFVPAAIFQLSLGFFHRRKYLSLAE
jgi:hypothetical protein